MDEECFVDAINNAFVSPHLSPSSFENTVDALLRRVLSYHSKQRCLIVLLSCLHVCFKVSLDLLFPGFGLSL